MIGGDGGKRMRSLIARYAAEWNCVMLLPQVFAERNQLVTNTLIAAGRDPELVRRSMMTGCLFGKDESAFKEKLSARKRTIEQLHERGIVAGNAATIKEQLHQLEKAGVQRTMLQSAESTSARGIGRSVRTARGQRAGTGIGLGGTRHDA